jgi:diguanylate cyclase (GGDEF)-like protein
MEKIKTQMTEMDRSLENEILYLNTHDKLTGLYNRNYFENELRMYDLSWQHPISVIIADINGLKIVNEVFGFAEGDLILTKVAGIIAQAAKVSGIAARWGEDEFAVFMPKTDETAASAACEQILKECASMDNSTIMPSLALASATKDETHDSISRILLKAEDRMYRNKLLETQSTHSTIISSLRKALLERSFETEEHAQRMREMSLKIGKALGLSRDKQDELCLLSVLHDIGKIAIPDRILSKPGKLTDDEWKEMKKHSEIGYRIASASNELSGIAEEILSHHEHWDGSGYPQGLKGEEIPKLSQIVAVVDTYDVITNERPYKAAMSHQDALKEIKRCSNTQFAPNIAETFLKLFETSAICPEPEDTLNDIIQIAVL